MSAIDVTTQPIMLFISAAAGQYTFAERLIRPKDFETLFPLGVHTFPGHAPKIHWTGFKISPDYGVISSGSKFAYYDNSAEDYTVPTSLYIHHIITTIYQLPGDVNFLDPQDPGRYRNRTLVYGERPLSSSAIPAYDPEIYASSVPEVFPLGTPRSRDVSGSWTDPKITHYWPRERITTAFTVGNETFQNPPETPNYYDSASILTAFVGLWDGWDVGLDPDQQADHLLRKGEPFVEDIRFDGTTHPNEPCPIGRAQSPVYYTTVDTMHGYNQYAWLSDATNFDIHSFVARPAYGGLLPSLATTLASGLLMMVAYGGGSLSSNQSNRFRRRRKKP